MPITRIHKRTQYAYRVRAHARVCVLLYVFRSTGDGIQNDHSVVVVV